MDRKQVLVATLIAVVIVGTVGIFLCKAYQLALYQQGNPSTQPKAQPSEESAQPKEASDIVELEMPSEAEMVDWKTCQDNDFSFQFRYPEEWFRAERRLSDSKITDFEIGSDDAPVHFGAYSDDKNIFLKPGSKILPFDYAKKFEDLALSGGYSSGFLQKENLPYYRYEWIDEGKHEGVSAGKQVVYEISGRGIEDYLILFQWSELVPDAKNIDSGNLIRSGLTLEDFEKAFSTFKFVYKPDKVEATLYRGNGIEVNFEGGYQEIEPSSEWPVSRLGFGPVEYREYSFVSGSYQHIYSLVFKEKKSAESIIAELEETGDYNMRPVKGIIGNNTVVQWTAGSLCDERIMEVIGKKMNYELTSGGCYTEEAHDFEYFKSVISQINFVD